RYILFEKGLDLRRVVVGEEGAALKEGKG
ncbi:hypothetical protein A2U01_0106984, partial [Trifolium medium]|nr:hypothetical protein [Trifolium medium]